MNVGIIGAGKVGYALGLAFYNENINVSGIYSKSSESALLLNRKILADFPNDLVETVKQSDVVFYLYLIITLKVLQKSYIKGFKNL